MSISRRGWSAMDAAGRMRWVLTGLAVFLLGYLVFSGKPWSVHVPAGKDLKVSQYVTIFGWYAAAINLVLTAVLAATVKLWTSEVHRAKPATILSRVPAPRWMWPWVLAAMACTAWLGFPRLSQSLWHDEAYPVRRAILGEYRANDDGTLTLRERSWRDAFFYFKKPNHIPHSAICRVCNEAWRAIARPVGLQFSEVALRLPTYFAGIAAVGMLALLIARMGFFPAAAVAAWLAALHPWMMRYTTEARAYAFVLLLVPVLIYLLLRALEEGKWKWWGWFAFAQFATLYFYLTTVFVLVVLNLCAALAIVWRWRASKQVLNQGARWVAANLFSAMAFLAMMLPCLPQFLNYLHETYGRGSVDFTWTQNFLSHLISGTSWNYSRIFESPYVELFPWAVHHPGLMVLAVFLGVGALALGIWRVAERGKYFGLMVLPLLLPAVLCYIEVRARDGHMYEWYLIFVLPGVIGLVSIGLASPWEVARSRVSKALGFGFLVAVVLAYAAWTSPKRSMLRNHSMQPNRESVLLTRPTLDPNDPRQKNILTATFFGEPDPYDPNIRFIVGNAGLEGVVREADAENKPLFINLGYLVTVEGEHANKYRFLKESGFFEDFGILYGDEPLQSRQVFRYRPQSAGGFDFSTIPVDKGSPNHPEK